MLQALANALPHFRHTNSGQFFLMAGPCVIEGEDMALRIAERIKHMTDKLQIPFVFKGSYRKANRSRLDSFTGIGDETALRILQKVGREIGVPTVTDIHESGEAALAAEYVDVLQIPAFLCRQTDLLIAAAQTGKVVNIKKGQFLSGEAMKWAVDKVRQAGNANVILTERGNSFGYSPRGRFPQPARHARVRRARGDGRNALAATPQPEQRRNRWPARPHRNHC